nr:unnamed protein product [Meloidogyne enterolobii]
MALRDLFIGPEGNPRWVRDKPCSNNDIYIYKCSGHRSGCQMRMIVRLGSINWIKITKGPHLNHEMRHERALMVALHFGSTGRVADGVVVPEI